MGKPKRTAGRTSRRSRQRAGRPGRTAPGSLQRQTGLGNDRINRENEGHREAAYTNGWQAGYEKGRLAGYSDFEQVFEGTSIIIPSFNQKDMLLQCLDSIAAYTPQPYEVIVVDDASSDGTAEALRNNRKIRLAVHESNKGFAGSINTGLMLAKGRTVLLLNNDVLVTDGWLGNMLDCLDSSPEIGAVGPVTNYIGGAQQIEVPYVSLEEMREFAKDRNRPDGSKWVKTDRLVGFCLLMRRETVLQTGYLDEGYKLGNYEDDDWIIRLRLQGLSLMIAGDAFVHHFGSVTMKSLDTRQFEETNERNRQLFQRKWGAVYDYLALQDKGGSSGWRQGCGSADGVPAKVVAESGSGRLYWLQDGMKFRISFEGRDLGLPYDGPKVRLSQRDLRSLPSAGERTLEQVNSALAALSAAAEALSANSAAGGGGSNFPLEEGIIAVTPEGERYQIDRGTARPILTSYTEEIWGLAERIVPVTAMELAVYPKGRPVLSPVILAAKEL